jgi:phenylalanyl-tRNA synthetase beta chain
VTIGPSPEWLKNTLAKMGVRSINNVVDVTNYVMLETGQPLHAFDYHLVEKGNARPTIVVRRATEGEKFTTLDGQSRTLTSQMLLIADEKKAIALAGVMGGQNSEINDKTVDVLIESACFKPQNIRATSKKLELRTESSYRFERGTDIEMADWASRRAAELILETAGGQLAEGVIDAYPKKFQANELTLRHGKVEQLLGVKIAPSENVSFLRRLGLSVLAERDESCAVRIPSFRLDLKREIDLIEEVTRVYGVDRIPATPPRGAIGSNAYDQVHDTLGEARRILTALGLQEAQGQTLIAAEAAKRSNSDYIALENPLSSDMDVLRPGLLPGLLDSLRHNLARNNQDVALFELGRVFTQTGGNPREERRIGIAITGRRNPLFWTGENRDASCDLFDLKGILETFLQQFGVRGVNYARREGPTSLLVESGTISLGKQSLGELGQLNPILARQYDLRDAVFLAELNFDLLLARRNKEKSFKPLPAFPSVRRDVAMLVSEATTHESVLNVVRQSKPANLESLELFDVFRGKSITAGQKSMAYAFIYRSPERTLTDNEVNTVHEKMVEQLKQSLAAVIRDN